MNISKFKIPRRKFSSHRWISSSSNKKANSMIDWAIIAYLTSPLIAFTAGSVYGAYEGFLDRKPFYFVIHKSITKGVQFSALCLMAPFLIPGWVYYEIVQHNE